MYGTCGTYGDIMPDAPLSPPAAGRAGVIVSAAIPPRERRRRSTARRAFSASAPADSTSTIARSSLAACSAPSSLSLARWRAAPTWRSPELLGSPGARAYEPRPASSFIGRLLTHPLLSESGSLRGRCTQLLYRGERVVATLPDSLERGRLRAPLRLGACRGQRALHGRPGLVELGCMPPVQRLHLVRVRARLHLVRMLRGAERLVERLLAPCVSQT